MAWRFHPLSWVGLRPHPHTDEQALPTPSAPSARLRAAGASAPLVARFWGVRGSYPSVMAGGTEVGGNTTCLEVRYGRRRVILDAGSGAIPLGEALAREWRATPDERPTVTMLFTHAHHDHLCGLPFFAPLFDARARLRLYGPDLADMRFGDIIAGYMRAPYFPVDFHTLPSDRALTSLADGDRLTIPEEGEPWVTHGGAARPIPGIANGRGECGGGDPLVVDALFSQLHPQNGVMVYRVSGGGARLVFATDVEVGARGAEADRRLVEFARGADALAHDAQYSERDYHDPDASRAKRGFGHSTPGMAARIARAAGVRRLVLLHHDPRYSDADVLALHGAAQQATRPGADRGVGPRGARDRAQGPAAPPDALRDESPDGPGEMEVITAREGLELRLDGARRRLV